MVSTDLEIESPERSIATPTTFRHNARELLTNHFIALLSLNHDFWLRQPTDLAARRQYEVCFTKLLWHANRRYLVKGT
jgi:hypothetical protein